jgi:hypothetical protein
MIKIKFKINIIWIRLIILKFLYFTVVIWQLIWTTCMSREFSNRLLLYSYRGLGESSLISLHWSEIWIVSLCQNRALLFLIDNSGIITRFWFILSTSYMNRSVQICTVVQTVLLLMIERIFSVYLRWPCVLFSPKEGVYIKEDNSTTPL